MKFRNGFVSNSSSSSFLIVGVEDENLVEKLKAASCGDMSERYVESDGSIRYETMEHGVIHAGLINFYGSYILEDCYLSGMPIEDLLETMNLAEIRLRFQKCVKEKYNINIDMSEICLHYGEVSDE